MASNTKMKVGPKDPPKNGLKPGEKAEPSTHRPFSIQGGIKPGSIQKMTPSDTVSGSFSKPGKRIDLSRSMKAIQGGSNVYQPEYIKLAPSKTVPKVTTNTTPTVTPPKVEPKKVEAAPKERVAYRSQTNIDENGKKTYKNVVYSKYVTGKGWVLTNVPLVVDKRKKQ
jgi:hypothetical protein